MWGSTALATACTPCAHTHVGPCHGRARPPAHAHLPCAPRVQQHHLTLQKPSKNAGSPLVYNATGASKHRSNSQAHQGREVRRRLGGGGGRAGPVCAHTSARARCAPTWDSSRCRLKPDTGTAPNVVRNGPNEEGEVPGSSCGRGPLPPAPRSWLSRPASGDAGCVLPALVLAAAPERARASGAAASGACARAAGRRWRGARRWAAQCSAPTCAAWCGGWGCCAHVVPTAERSPP